MTIRRLPSLVLFAAFSACQQEEETPIEPAPRPEPPVVEAPAPIEPAPIEPVLETPEPPAPPPPVVVSDPVIERAIEPVDEAVEIVATVDRGTTSYVLFRWDGAKVAEASLSEGAFTAIEEAVDECQDGDQYQAFSCAVDVAPDAYLAARAVCHAHAWGVAIVRHRGAAYERTARRFLYALDCGDEQAEEPASIRARDVDADGAHELIVTVPIRALRDDAGMNGGDTGVIAYVLDADDLRTQFRVTSHYDSSVVDVSGTNTYCRGAWRFTDVNHDGHDDIRVRATCEIARQSEIDDVDPPTHTNDARDCLYDAASDAWPCGEPPIADWLFNGTSSGSVLGETPEDAANAMGPRLGTAVPRAEEAVDGEEDYEDEPEAPPARTCVRVVADPAPPLRVRETPSTSANAVGELANGTELTFLETRGRWARIASPAGWVWTENVVERCSP